MAVNVIVVAQPFRAALRDVSRPEDLRYDDGSYAIAGLKDCATTAG
jgi:hypothetical protein